MRRVTLVRHGRAAPQAAGGDFFRPLDDQGRSEVARTAIAIGAAVRTPPDAVLASAALRTRETAQILHDHWVPAVLSSLPLAFARELYHADPQVLEQALRSTAADVHHLLLVGHNPGISELALRWARQLGKPHHFDGLDTAGWCSAGFPISDWSALGVPCEARFDPAPHG